ncbi:MAG: DUF302 domain-containing protein [bacterium]|nr:DUF302 domain-containing protein [bacterium]
MNYYISKTVNQNFEDAIQHVTEKLKDEGFGVLTEIDVKETLKKKLDVDFKKYKILGACNPNFAHQALLKEDKIGSMLPCNVIVEEHEDGSVEVSAVNPLASMQAVPNEELHAIADKVNASLTRIIEGL